MELKVTGLRSLELAVTDLEASVEFYQSCWGLTQVSRQGSTAYLRATGAEHHILALHERARPAFVAVNLMARDRATVQGLHDHAVARGAAIVSPPGELPEAAGGGFGFALRTPEGHEIKVSSNVWRHADVIHDPSKPYKLSHVVLNTTQLDQQRDFIMDVLGFRLSDSTGFMEFLRCCSDHHSIAFATGPGVSLNHVAFDMHNIDGVMRGAGRLKQHGYNIEWGLGRHGPGDNVFAYFVDPNGFAIEYTTEVEQVDDDTYQHGDPHYWANGVLRPCRWGMADTPSDRIKQAFSGQAQLQE